MSINREHIENIVSVDYNWIVGRASSQMGGRDVNQDCWGALDTPHGFLVVVCDGMGGMQAGELASSLAVDTILRTVKDAPEDDTRKDIITKAIRKANEAIIQRGIDEPSYQGMGTTCIVLLINEESAIAGYVGDSRIYQFQGRHKKWRTFDHSMVFSLVKQGVITEEQARLSAQSNVITRALGMKGNVQSDVVELPFEKGDRFVLTTDGAHGSMPEPKMIERLTNHKAPLILVLEDFVREVEKIGITNGGRHDNHTIAVIDVNKKSTLEGKMNKKSKQIITSLAVLLCISVVLNIVQCTHHNKHAIENAPIETATVVDKGVIDEVGDTDDLNDAAQQESENATEASIQTKESPEQTEPSSPVAQPNVYKAKAQTTTATPKVNKPTHQSGATNGASKPSNSNVNGVVNGNGNPEPQPNPLQVALDNNKLILEKTAAAKEKVESEKEKATQKEK